MAIWYVDLTNGNDTTGDGSAGNPYKTHNKAVTVAVSGDEVRLAKTASHTQISSSSCTFTDGSLSVGTSVSLVGTIAAGDYISKTTAAGNGSMETFYRVASLTASIITLEQKYYGTTETVSTILKANYAIDTGQYSTNSYTCYMNNKNMTFTGGWNLSGTPTQDGETWFRGQPASRATGWVIYQSAGTTVLSISKINVLETNRVVSTTTNASSFSNCTWSAYSFPWYNSYLNNFTNCALIGYSGGNGIQLDAAGSVSLTSCLIQCLNATGMYVNASGLTLNLSNSIISGCTTGINIAVYSGLKLNMTGTYIRYCTNGISAAGNGNLINGGNTLNCTYGIYFNGGYTSYIVKNFNTVGSTSAGMYCYQFFGAEFFGGSSTNDKYGFDIDQYSRNIRISNYTFTTPVTYGVNAVYNCDTVYMTDCTIDLASKLKAFYDVTGGNYARPRFLIENFTNLDTGAYYNYQSIIKSDSVYRTTPPCYQFTFKSTQSYQLNPIKMFSTYAVSGQGYKLSCYIKSNASWSGSLVPVIKLNGAEIMTGDTITTSSTPALTTSWNKFEYSVTSNLITRNGELSLEFICNANTIAFYFDDFEVVDL